MMTRKQDAEVMAMFSPSEIRFLLYLVEHCEEHINVDRETRAVVTRRLRFVYDESQKAGPNQGNALVKAKRGR